MSENIRAPWSVSEETVLADLKTSPEGLTTEEHQRRLELYGENTLRVKKTTWYGVLWQQLIDPLVNFVVWIIIGLIIVSYSKELTTFLATFLSFIPVLDAGTHFAAVIMMFAAVGVGVALSFWADYGAGLLMDSLASDTAPTCTVIRDGRVHPDTPTASLVIGDWVELEEGSKTPADIRIIVTAGIESDEASLTGESEPSEKHNMVLPEETTIGDRHNMLHQTCDITYGKAGGVVVATANDTEVGKIADDVATASAHRTPLQRKMYEFVNALRRWITAFAGVCFLAALAGDVPVMDSVVLALTAAVATIPSMLPAVQTLLLKSSADVMNDFKCYVRKLSAIEALGSVMSFNSDKTGTLTCNEMCITQIYAGGTAYTVSGEGYSTEGDISHDGIMLKDLPPSMKHLCQVARHCGDAHVDDKQIHGDSVDRAMLVLALKARITEPGVLETARIAFQSTAGYMVVVVKYPNGAHRLFIKGAPERVVDKCSRQLDVNGTLQELDENAVLQATDTMASQALRTIGCAYKDLPESMEDVTHDDLHDLTFVGVVGMIDPPREDVAPAIATLSEAGIRTVMITGDHAKTAEAIARQLKIDTTHGVTTGNEWSDMESEKREQVAGTCNVFARVSPHQKLEIVKAQQDAGEIVAMTGDGVNDAPALAQADIGVAMGSGTEVAQGAAAMVLQDDKFSTFVPAVREGRHMYSVLRRVILYTMPTNVGQGTLVLFASVGANFIPLLQHAPALTITMILLINLIDLLLFTMPYTAEKKDPTLMRQQPRDPQAKIADEIFLFRSAMNGLLIALTGIVTYLITGWDAVVGGELVEGGELIIAQAQTAAFWAVLFAHIGYVFVARQILTPFWKYNLFGNWLLNLGVVASILLRLAMSWIPELGEFFGTVDIPVEWWPYLILCIIPTFAASELDKAYRRHKLAQQEKIALA